MDPPKDPRPPGPQRSTENTKEGKDPNTNRKPPGRKQRLPPRLPGPHRSTKYTGKEDPNKNSIKNLMVPPRRTQSKETSTSSMLRPPSMQSKGTSTSSMPPPRRTQSRETSTSSMLRPPSMQSKGTSTSSMPPPRRTQSRETSTSSMFRPPSMQSKGTSTSSRLPPRHPSNSSNPQQRGRASLRRTQNSRSLVTMGSDDRSGRNNDTFPPSTRNNGLPAFTLPPKKPPIRYLSQQPVNTSQRPPLTALELLTNSRQRSPSSSSPSRTVLDTLQASNNSQSRPGDRIERIQQHLSALQRGTIALIGFEVEEGEGRKLTFTFQYEDYHDTIIYYEHLGKLSFYITKNGKAVSRTEIPQNVRDVFDQQKKLIRNTIWNKVFFNGKDYVLVFDKKSYKGSYLELKDGKYIVIALENCENDLRLFLIDETVSMKEDYEATTFFSDLEKDLQSIYHVYTDPDDGIRKLTQIGPNKTWTYKNDIIFSVQPDYTMTNVTSKVKELIKNLEDNPDDETLKNLYCNDYLEKPIKDCDADINLIQEKLDEMKAKRRL